MLGLNVPKAAFEGSLGVEAPASTAHLSGGGDLVQHEAYCFEDGLEVLSPARPKLCRRVQFLSHLRV